MISLARRTFAGGLVHHQAVDWHRMTVSRIALTRRPSFPTVIRTAPSDPLATLWGDDFDS